MKEMHQAVDNTILYKFVAFCIKVTIDVPVRV